MRRCRVNTSFKVNEHRCERQARRTMRWVAVVALLMASAGTVGAQSDSAIVLQIPTVASAAHCSTSVAHTTGVVTISLDLQPGPLADSRMTIAEFDSSGRPLTLRDAVFRISSPSIESAVVQFDSAGAAHCGVGQHLTPADYPRDSTGALHPRMDRPTFHALRREQFRQAERVTAWLWR